MNDQEPRDPTTEFAIPIGTGLRRIPPGAGEEFDAETAQQIHDRLNEFDAVRTRGDVESRTAELGTRFQS